MDPSKLWKYTGVERPDFADSPGSGQESVWDYPRPPKINPTHALVIVRAGMSVLAQTRSAVRICETASPPGYYIPYEDVNLSELKDISGRSFCEWKGAASYLALLNDPDDVPVAWFYPEPKEDFIAIQNHVSFYPGRVDCFVDDERVRPQAGGFYGGWITDAIVGPFKGDKGTSDW